MNLPGTETEGAAHEAPRRRVILLVVLAVTALGVAGVTASSFVGHDTRRVVSTAAAPNIPAGVTAPVSDTTTTRPTRSTTITPAPVPVASALAPPSTTPPSTIGYAPPATEPATVPVTTPPTSAAPKTTITVAAAGVQIKPSTATFPSTPPPYWPMPIVTITITNSGGVAVRSIVVHPVGVYSVPSSSCTTLTPGRSCVAEVQFCPTSPSHYLNTLLVTGQDSVTGAPLRATITLDGVAT